MYLFLKFVYLSSSLCKIYLSEELFSIYILFSLSYTFFMKGFTALIFENLNLFYSEVFDLGGVVFF
jgi:hypothetical protein